MTRAEATSFLVRPGGQLSGTLRVPGDKSISHRFVMLASIARGTSHAQGFLEGADALATVAAFRAMGVVIEGPNAGELRIHGVGHHGLQRPAHDLDMGNSGTAMRLLCGLLAGQRFSSRLVGDRSLSARPMGRVLAPLREMGARVRSHDGERPPLCIEASDGPLHGIDYLLPVASAQVKSCLLLAGLYAQAAVTVREPEPTRDHTERMLTGFGVPLSVEPGKVTVAPGARLHASNLDIPADISSAAFFIAGACMAPGSDVTLTNVGMNPTRTGALAVLERMGADIKALHPRMSGGEPVADLRVRYRPLHGIDIPQSLVPLAIDEFPSLMVVAATARGRTQLRGARELRVKESDRIAALAKGLSAIGVQTQEFDDGLALEGGQEIIGGEVDSEGDHRIAMAFAMAALASRAPIKIHDCANVSTSFPGFATLAAGAGLDIAEVGVGE